MSDKRRRKVFNKNDRRVNGLPHGWDFEDVPLDGSVKLGQINADVDDIAATNFVDVSKINLRKSKRIVCLKRDRKIFFFYGIVLLENKEKKKLSFSLSPSLSYLFRFRRGFIIVQRYNFELGNRTYQSVRLIEETRGITVDTFDPFEGWNAIRCS